MFRELIDYWSKVAFGEYTVGQFSCKVTSVE